LQSTNLPLKNLLDKESGKSQILLKKTKDKPLCGTQKYRRKCKAKKHINIKKEHP